MDPFKIYVLGCGSALPTMRHNPSSQIVELRGKQFMIDCGEGTQLQLRRSKIRFTKLGHVFISHLHGDHCFGLLGMISTFGMLGRTAPLHVFAPGEYAQLFAKELEFFCNRIEYEVVFHPIDPSVSSVIYEDRSMTVSTLPLNHKVPCCGFLFSEKPGLPHIRRDMIDMYGIPTSQINNIKNGIDWTTPDGEVIPASRLTTPANKPRSYAYCSDTRYNPALAEMVRGVNTLYHEATYADIDQLRAEKYFHSTAAEAATTARDAGVGQLIIGHYSQRYNSEDILLAEARKVFQNTVLAKENAQFNIF